MKQSSYRHIHCNSEYILLQDESAASYQFIIDKVAEFKKELDALNLGKAIPVGTADAGSAITANLAQNVDFVMVRACLAIHQATVSQTSLSIYCRRMFTPGSEACRSTRQLGGHGSSLKT